MGKKAKNKQEKKRAKVAGKVDRWIAEQDLSEQELMMAGLGLMARAVEQSKKKAFKKAVKAGRRLNEVGLPSFEALLAQDVAESDAGDDAGDAVISYGARGGGWYGVSVDGVMVDSVKGEEAAAARAGELLAAHAALDPDSQERVRTGMFHTGGGWYELLVRGVPVDRVRGKEAAEERLAEIESLS